jgi:Protein of unknwon function (DUF3310)
MARQPAKQTSDYERIVHPEHYGGDTVYEVIKVIDAWGLGFKLGNAVKYIARAGKKPGTDDLEDLKKALFYLNHEIDGIEKTLAGALVVKPR